MRAETIGRIDARADELVKVAVKGFCIKRFQTLLPAMEQAPSFTTGDGYNLFHAFFKKLIIDKRLQAVSTQALEEMLTSFFQFQAACKNVHPRMTAWFHETTPGNYKSQPLHVVVDSNQFRFMGELLNWLIENQHWTTLLGAGINYPLFGRFYFEANPRFMFGLDSKDKLKLLAPDQANEPLNALERVISPQRERFAQYVELMQHFACYGWDGLSRAGSSIVWGFVWNLSRREPSVAYLPVTLGKDNSTFPDITEQDLPLFQQLMAFLPKIEGEERRGISVLVKNFLRGQWAYQSSDAYASLYRLLRLYLKKFEDKEYVFGHYLFMYVYMIRYGALEKLPAIFFEDMHSFILSCGDIAISKGINVSLLLLMVQLAEFSYSRNECLPKVLHDAATKEGNKRALELIDRYEHPLLAAAIQETDFYRFVSSLKRCKLCCESFTDLFNFACQVDVSSRLKNEHQKIMQVMFDGLCVLNKDLAASLNLLARGLLKLEKNIFSKESEFLKLELPENCSKQCVEALITRYTSCKNLRVHSVDGCCYLTLVHQTERFRSCPKPAEKLESSVVIAASPPERPPEPKKTEEPKKLVCSREEPINKEALNHVLQEWKAKLAPWAIRVLALEKKLQKPAPNLRELELELKQIQQELSEGLNEIAIDRSLKLKRISGVTETVFYEKFNKLAKKLGEKSRRVALLFNQCQQALELSVAAKQDPVYLGPLGLFAPIGGLKSQGDRPVEQCFRGFVVQR